MPESSDATPPALASTAGAEPAAPRETTIGHVDGISPEGRLEGWAVDLLAPRRPVEVRVLDSGRLVAIGTADRERPDVAQAGFSAGLSGFSLVLPDEVFDGQPHSLAVMARAPNVPPKLLGKVEAVLMPRKPTVTRGAAGGVAAAAAVDPRTTLQGVRSTFADATLSAALARIDELERAQRSLNAERETLRAQLRTLSERFTRDLNTLSTAPWNDKIAGYLGSIVRTVSLTRRRDLWLRELADRRLSGPIFAAMPHDGAPGPLNILVWGSGGIGDLLYLGTVVRELFRLFENPRIYVLNENPGVAEVFANNPYVVGTLYLQGSALYDFVSAIHSLDVFDLVAEVRYCITYTAPPLSRVPNAFLANASFRSADWQKFVRYRWPHLNNLFGNEVMARGMTKLDLVGLTSTLPIDSSTEVDFFLPGHYPQLLTGLIGTPFVTVHHGSDKRMAAAGGMQTKNLPTATWNRIVELLAAAGLKTVQLGESHETLLAGVDVDLRGKTTLAQTAYVLKHASVHVDTEGGLVHLARAMHTTSVVVFGPTPVGFFGYPQNHNVAPPLCGNCWWTTDRWSTQCPRELAEPECMTSQPAEPIVERAIEQTRQRRAFDVVEGQLVAAGVAPAFLADAMTQRAGRRTQGAVILGRGADMQLIRDLPRPAGEVTYMVPVSEFAAVYDNFGHLYPILPYGDGGIARNSASLDWIVAFGWDMASSELMPLCLDALRCLRPTGRAWVGFAVPVGGTADDVHWAFDLAEARQIGVKYTLRWPEAVEVAGAAVGAAAGGAAVLFLGIGDRSELPVRAAAPAIAAPVIAAPAVAAPAAAASAVAAPVVAEAAAPAPAVADATAAAKKPEAKRRGGAAARGGTAADDLPETV